MMSPFVVFRADASRTIGSGHVMRCLTLATALRDLGMTAVFVSREHDGHLCHVIQERGFAITRLSVSTAAVPIDPTLAHASWLGASWQEDAEQTRVAVEALGAKPDWLVADHYAIDGRWERVLRPAVGQLMVIDDLADRPHDCDLLLDQNLVAQKQTRYAGKVAPSCGLLLGPDYALLQPVYAEAHDRVPARKGPIRRIAISFGGADNDNLTGCSVRGFLKLDRPDIEVDVVVAANSPHALAIREQLAEHANIHLHCSLPTLAPLFAKADLAVGGSGATNWERLCLGLPALVVTMAENQRPIADELSERHLIRPLGDHTVVDEKAIADALRTVIHEGLDVEWSRRCLAAVDGKGLSRVCAAMTVTASTPLLARHARLEDEALLLKWANDPNTRRNAFSQQPITAESHRNWLRGRLRDSGACQLYLVETESGVPVGQVRFDREDRTWGIDYALAPYLRGRGLGRSLLHVALLSLGDVEPGALVSGRVKLSNQPSCRVFESLRFDAHRTGETVEFRRQI